jgi:hypothetical protein
LPERAKADPREFAHTALGACNFAVHLPGRQIDESRRQIGDERLEAQAVFEFGTQGGVFRAHRMVASPR